MNGTNLGRVTLGEIFTGLSRLFALSDENDEQNENRKNDESNKHRQSLQTEKNIPKKESSFFEDEPGGDCGNETDKVQFRHDTENEIKSCLNENNPARQDDEDNFEDDIQVDFLEQMKNESMTKDERIARPTGIPSVSELPILEATTDYQEFDAINWSTLKRFLDDPRWFSLHPYFEPEVTEAMKLGSMIHCAVLNKEKFADQYERFIAPINEKTGEPYKSGKIYESARDAFEQSGKFACTANQMAICTEIVRSMDDSGLLEILGVSGSSFEETVVTEVPLYDSREGLKGKIDCYNEKYGLFEFKTVSMPIHDAFGRDQFSYKIRQYGYVYQIAFYAKIIYNQTGYVPPCFIIAAETAEPYRCGIYEIQKRKIQEALERIDREFLPYYLKLLNGTCNKRLYSFVI